MEKEKQGATEKKNLPTENILIHMKEEILPTIEECEKKLSEKW